MSSAQLTTSLSKAEPPFFVGIDVGGTNIKFGLVDNRGLTLAETSIPTHVQDGPEQGPGAWPTR